MAFQLERKLTKNDGAIYEATEEQDGYLTLDDATIVPRPRPELETEIPQNLNELHVNRPGSVASEKKPCRSKLPLITLPVLLVIFTMLCLQIYSSTDMSRRMESISIGLTDVIANLTHIPHTTGDDLLSALGIMSGDTDKIGLARVSNTSISDGRLTPCTVTLRYGDGGTPFDDRPLYVTHGNITALEFRVARGAYTQLEGLRVRYGNVFSDWRGRYLNSVFNTHRIDLEQDELITGLRMFCGWEGGDNPKWAGVMGVSVTTNKAKNGRVYGSSTDNIISVIKATWTELFYFTGRSGLIIDSLGVHAIGCRDHLLTVN